MSINDAELLRLIRRAVRECSFDFDRAAALVRGHYAERGAAGCIQAHELGYTGISASDCRIQFAVDYDSSGTGAAPSPPLLSEPQTFDDVLQLQRHIEEQSRLSHARVFNRIGHAGDFVVWHIRTGDSVLSSNDEVILAVERRAEQRRLEEHAAELRKLEMAEAERLKGERERLRNRFKDGSLDAEGVDPLALRDDEAEPIHVDRSDRDVVPTRFDINDLLNSSEFDDLLTEIEKSIENDPDDKSACTSELGEVLQYLEQSAKSRQPRGTVAGIAPVLRSAAVSTSKTKEDETNLSCNVLGSFTDEKKMLNETVTNTFDKSKLISSMPVLDRAGRLQTVDSSDDEEDNNFVDKDWLRSRNQLKEAAANSIAGKDSRDTDIWNGRNVAHSVKIFDSHLDSMSIENQGIILDEEKNAFSDEINIYGPESCSECSIDDTLSLSEAVAEIDCCDDDNENNEFDEALSNKFQDSENINEGSNDLLWVVDEKPGDNRIALGEPAVAIDDIILNLGARSADQGINGFVRGGLLVVSSNEISEDVGATSSVPDCTKDSFQGSKHQRRARKESRFASSIAEARNNFKPSESLQSLETAIPNISVASVSISDENCALSSHDLIAPCSNADLLQEKLSQSSAVPSFRVAPCVPLSVHSLFQNYLTDSSISAGDMKEWDHMPLIRFDVTGCIKSSSDAGIAGFLSWFFEYALNTKVRLLCLHLTDDTGSNYIKNYTSEQQLVNIPRILNVLVRCQANSIEWENSLMKALHVLTLADFLKRDLVSSSSSGVACDVFGLFCVPDCTVLEDFTRVVTYRKSRAEYFKCFHDMLTYQSALNLASTHPLSSVLSGYSSRSLSEHFVTCAMKPYLTSDSSDIAVLGRFLQHCEEAGFRLIGLRSAFVSQSWLAQNVATARILPSWVEKVQRRSIAESLMNFGLACLDDETTVVIAVSFYFSNPTAVEVMRNLLGPDDPALARRTDPVSLRSKLGDKADRNKNLCYPIPVSLEHSKRDTSFLFCGDNHCGSFSTVYLPPLQIVTIVFKIGINPDFMKESRTFKKALACVQRFIMYHLLNIAKRGFILDFIKCIDSKNYDRFKSYMEIVSSSLFEQHGAGNDFMWVARFHSAAGWLAIQYIKSVLVEAAADLPTKVKIDPSYLSVDILINTASMAEDCANWESAVNSETPWAGDAVSIFGGDEDNKTSFLSHENLILPDCVLLLFSPQILFQLPHRDTIFSLFFEVLDSLISIIPDISVVGLNMNTEEDHIAPLVCIRGTQIIENIDDVITRAVANLLEKVGNDSKHCLSESHSAQNSSGMGSKKFIKVLKGKHALDLLIKRFRPTELLKFDALSDLTEYVPRSCWAPLGVANERIMEHLVLLRSYFLPGVFDAVSIIVIPDMKTTSFLEKALSRVLKRLEKEDIHILMIKHVDADENSRWSQLLFDDSCNEYCWDREEKTRAGLCLQTGLGKAHIAILVKGTGIIRRLRTIIGPPCVTDYSHHPRSVTASLAAGGLLGVPIFAALSCNTVDLVSSEIFGIGLENALTLPVIGAVSNSSLGYTEDINIKATIGKLLEETVVELPGIHYLGEQRIILTPDMDNLSISKVSNLTSYDLSCFVITSALVREVGFASIVDCLCRERLKIVNSKTLFLDTVTAKKILAISGHSSLSLHAPIIHLVDGPAICLAIEGNAHTIMRLRALTVDTKNFGEGSSNRCLWKLQSGEWGVIASSSVRLARELILFCFNCLHGALKISKQGNENITACRTTAQSVSSLK